MTRRSIVLVLVVLAFGVGVVYGIYWWMHRIPGGPDIPSGEELLTRVPNDLVPMVGTISSVDADRLILITEQYIESPSGRYLAQQEHRFRFVSDTNIIMMLRTPTPAVAPPTLGEDSAFPEILVEPDDLTPGSSVIVLYSAADSDVIPVAWRVYIQQP
ncbi:MAG TPA: hypothetical protein VJ553_04250 [Candidatus Paceibacterota bacterium]|nr:hypothetical protein [Candidatus Paceibacterota bacterium]